MNVTLSIDDEVMRRARARAQALGTSVNQMIREYLGQVAGATNPAADADEFAHLSGLTRGNSRGWRFDREELHERR